MNVNGVGLPFVKPNVLSRNDLKIRRDQLRASVQPGSEAVVPSLCFEIDRALLVGTGVFKDPITYQRYSLMGTGERLLGGMFAIEYDESEFDEELFVGTRQEAMRFIRECDLPGDGVSVPISTDKGWVVYKMNPSVETKQAGLIRSLSAENEALIAENNELKAKCSQFEKGLIEYSNGLSADRKREFFDCLTVAINHIDLADKNAKKIKKDGVNKLVTSGLKTAVNVITSAFTTFGIGSVIEGIKGLIECNDDRKLIKRASSIRNSLESAKGKIQMAMA